MPHNQRIVRVHPTMFKCKLWIRKVHGISPVDDTGILLVSSDHLVIVRVCMCASGCLASSTKRRPGSCCLNTQKLPRGWLTLGKAELANQQALWVQWGRGGGADRGCYPFRNASPESRKVVKWNAEDTMNWLRRDHSASKEDYMVNYIYLEIPNQRKSS